MVKEKIQSQGIENHELPELKAEIYGSKST
jgi:hypothetical protein